MDKNKRKRRILHIVSSLNISNGVMSVIMNYYRKINKNDIQFDFLYFIDNNDVNYEEEIKIYNGKTYKISSPYNYRKFKKEYSLFLNEHKEDYDIYHLHQSYLCYHFFAPLKKAGISNRVVHSHTDKYSDTIPGKIKNYILYKSMYFYATDYFACSKLAAKIMTKPKDKDVFILNNAIEIEKFKFNTKLREKYREILGVESDFVIGSVARYNNQKNPLFLLDVFYEVIKICPNARLIMIGNGPLKDKIECKIKRLNLTNNTLLLKPTDKVHELLNAFDAFVLCTRYEGLGIVLVEAQANGLNTFTTTNVPEETQLTERIYYLSLNENPRSWAEKIINTKRNNDYLRKEINSALIGTTFDINCQVKLLEKKYFEIVSRK